MADLGPAHEQDQQAGEEDPRALALLADVLALAHALQHAQTRCANWRKLHCRQLTQCAAQAFSGANAKKLKDSAEKIMMKQRRTRNKLGKAGEADRFIGDLKPKHMLSGKTSGQKTRDRR